MTDAGAGGRPVSGLFCANIFSPFLARRQIPGTQKATKLCALDLAQYSGFGFKFG